MTGRVKGAAGVRKLLRALPDAARDGMADVLDDYGSKVLAAMRQDVAYKTGFLRSRLSKNLSRKSLRLKVGFIGKRANGAIKLRGDQFVGKQFYGRFIEFGRKAQTVTVRRRRAGGKGLRNGKKKAEDIAATYQLRVRAQGARPFVFKKRAALRGGLTTSLNTYWDDVLTAAASGASFDD
ncbi:HK97 gp10 family phage protein [Sphingomonas montana]|uniref:HK97 gp10 family phage protein n=1 Tax=Sphingomonas montana TaxID=1843236 RepID=UPI00096D60D4|nr:HK97 gp10 family phage protein [Sphingomonas montana]